jgi:hypothetical protein
MELSHQLVDMLRATKRDGAWATRQESFWVTDGNNGTVEAMARGSSLWDKKVRAMHVAKDILSQGSEFLVVLRGSVL